MPILTHYSYRVRAAQVAGSDVRCGKTICRLLRSLAKGDAITQEPNKLENSVFVDQLGDNH